MNVRLTTISDSYKRLLDSLAIDAGKNWLLLRAVRKTRRSLVGSQLKAAFPRELRGGAASLIALLVMAQLKKLAEPGSLEFDARKKLSLWVSEHDGSVKVVQYYPMAA